MPLAIHEDALPGRTLLDKCRRAEELDIAGVAFDAAGLSDRAEAIAEALVATGRRAAAIHMGRYDGYLSPLPAEREAAISHLRETMACAVDLEAAHVIVVPHYGGPRMPDLTPYRSPFELESEMLVWLLRTVSDLAYALGVELDLLPVNRYESYFLNRLEQAVAFRARIKDHPHVRVAASTAHMALEEANIVATLAEHGAHLSYVQLDDPSGRLIGGGLVDPAVIQGALAAIPYRGWVTLHGAGSAAELAACVEHLRALGLDRV